MGSGVSSHTSNDHIDVGMRGQKFKERHHGTAPEPRPTKRKSFIQRWMHYGKKSEKAKKRWNHLSQDAYFTKKGTNTGKIFENKLSTLGPTLINLKNAQDKQDKYHGKSIDRKDKDYDPILIFELDYTSLAAVLIQRLIRGHLTRSAYNFGLHGTLKDLNKLKENNNYLTTTMKKGQNTVETKTEYPESPSASGSPTTSSPTINATPPSKQPQQSNEESPTTTPSNTATPSTNTAMRLQMTDKYFEHHHEMTEMFKQKAIRAKKLGDIKLALEYMQKYKALKMFIPNSNASPSSTLSTSPAIFVKHFNDGSAHLVEDYKQKAMSARKNQDTKLALQYMTKYKSLHSLTKDSRQESPPTTTPPVSTADTESAKRSLKKRIETTKKAAIDAKRAGEVTEALTQMKLYKSLIAEQRTIGLSEQPETGATAGNSQKKKTRNLPS